MTSLPTRLTAEQVLQITDRDCYVGECNAMEELNAASKDRRALLAHVEALEGELAAQVSRANRAEIERETVADVAARQVTRIASLEADLAACRRDAERVRGAISAAEGSLTQIDYRTTSESMVRDTVTNLKMMLRAALSAQAGKGERGYMGDINGPGCDPDVP